MISTVPLYIAVCILESSSKLYCYCWLNGSNITIFLIIGILLDSQYTREETWYKTTGVFSWEDKLLRRLLREKGSLVPIPGFVALWVKLLMMLLLASHTEAMTLLVEATQPLIQLLANEAGKLGKDDPFTRPLSPLWETWKTFFVPGSCLRPNTAQALWTVNQCLEALPLPCLLFLWLYFSNK